MKLAVCILQKNVVKLSPASPVQWLNNGQGGATNELRLAIYFIHGIDPCVDLGRDQAAPLENRKA